MMLSLLARADHGAGGIDAKGAVRDFDVHNLGENAL